MIIDLNNTPQLYFFLFIMLAPLWVLACYIHNTKRKEKLKVQQVQDDYAQELKDIKLEIERKKLEKITLENKEKLWYT